ncbi:MAG: bis(5'-nucleosyl)-tetraphosphatase (symmetrical) YqeK [Lachnospiraceae bacterium]|nr:bis(5'-nucleosyl)-tetraphosphatase (symmetrical) YqeK [Lachnospiraceae bacterium]
MEKVVYDLQKMEKKLKKYLDRNRFIHTQGVMYTCASLAMVHDIELDKAQVTGLLHDCAKCIPNDKKLSICKKNRIPVSELEAENPFLLHAKLGAYLAEKKYHVSDREILSAITCHTTGKPMMSTLEKIVFVSDYIEPHRNKAPNLSQIRKMAFIDLDECVYLILRDTLHYLNNNPKTIDTTTEDAFVYYKELHDEKQEENN